MTSESVNHGISRQTICYTTDACGIYSTLDLHDIINQDVNSDEYMAHYLKMSILPVFNNFFAVCSSVKMSSLFKEDNNSDELLSLSCSGSIGFSHTYCCSPHTN